MSIYCRLLRMHVFQRFSISTLKDTQSLRASTMDFRGFDSSIMSIVRGGIPRPTGTCPGMFESSNLSRDNVSTGR